MSPLTSGIRPATRGPRPLVTLLLAVMAAGAFAYARSGPDPEPVVTTNVVADSPTGDRVVDVRQELDSLMEEVEDLGEPVEEFETFDQCAYLLGVSEFGTRGGGSGYVYGPGSRPAPGRAGHRHPRDGCTSVPAAGVPRRRATEHRVQRGRRWPVHQLGHGPAVDAKPNTPERSHPMLLFTLLTPMTLLVTLPAMDRLERWVARPQPTQPTSTTR